MLKEFAVDPGVIASSVETCRFLVSQFGADKGRLISKFPKNWKRRAIEAADQLPDGYRKERVVEYLSTINNDWLTLIASNRPYEAPGEDWLANAIAAHAKEPFNAIVCNRDDPAGQLASAENCDRDPLFSAKTMDAVDRNAAALSSVAEPLLKSCHVLRFVDPYFDPGRPKWRNSLSAMLSLVPDITKVECEYHLEERNDSPSLDLFKRRLAQLNGVIPDGGTLRIIRWKEKDGGERFHRRYLLTNNAGLYYEGGLDEEVGADHTNDVSLLSQELHAKRWSEYELTSQVYELVPPVLVVDSQGNVTEL